jgi:hypothetical protein
MTTITAISLRNRRDVHIAERDEVPQFRTRGPKQRDPCWETEDNMAMLDTAFRGFHCGPIYIIHDIDANIDDVFDGSHRCEAIFNYIDNKYPITKGKKDTIQWETSPLHNHVGKLFKELPLTMQKQLKEYNFYINTIDSETANDSQALKMLWERLSKAGKKLNNFETKIQTHSILQKEILQPCANEWLNTPLFSAEKSKRGQVEMKLQKILALSEKDILPTYSSMDDLVEKWSEDVLGKTIDSIDTNTNLKKESLLSRLRFMRNILKELQDRNVFHNETESIMDKSKDVPLLIVIGRLANWFPTMAGFRRVANDVCPKVHEILVMNPNDLCKYLKVSSRNATFQKKLIEDLDNKFKIYTDKAKERRCFTNAEKKRKLDEQKGLCTLCSKAILDHQRNAGDHIIEYCKGGDTSYENLQMVHKICHEEKNL